MKRVVASLAIIILAGFICHAQNLLPETWKFSTGDNAEYALTSFDDSGWKTIVPGTVWEKQGYPAYDGYAWYRVTFVIPASLKKDAMRYGGLVVSLGRIDDSDETFFNGATHWCNRENASSSRNSMEYSSGLFHSGG